MAEAELSRCLEADMDKMGIDLGKRKSAVCVMDGPDHVKERLVMTTTRAALTRLLGKQRPTDVAIEACRDALWVHKELTGLGHKVIVVDASRARAVGIGHCRRKNDRRDAEALARGLWAGTLPRAHVLSERAARLRDTLYARAALVRQRAKLVTMLRGQAQAVGCRSPACPAGVFAKRVRDEKADWSAPAHVQSLLRVLETLGTEIQTLEAHLDALAEREPAYALHCTVTGVKRIVSLSFIAAIDEPRRFHSAHEVEAYLGLVASETTTGFHRRLGGITKAGNPQARAALIEAASSMLLSRKCASDPLRVWADQLVKRRGRKIAVVALARRLAGVLWAMWRDGTAYNAKAVGLKSAAGIERRSRRSRREAQAMRATTHAL